jgi:hypothetical protein
MAEDQGMAGRPHVGRRDCRAEVRQSDWNSRSRCLRDSHVHEMVEGMGRRSKQADPAVMFVRCDGAYAVDVAGESHYQEAIGECVAAGPMEITSDSRCSCEFNVRLVREPDNQYDANAVAVRSSTGQTLGHLPRAAAGEFAPVLDRISGLAVVECAARAYGRRMDLRARGTSGSGWIFPTPQSCRRRSRDCIPRRSRRSTNTNGVTFQRKEELGAWLQ